MGTDLINYSALVREHFRAPRNAGAFPAGTEGVIEGRAGSRRQGREIAFALRLDGAGRVLECRYRVYGCPATVALCSVLSERLQGRTLPELSEPGLALAEELELPPTKRSAALLLEDALKAALARYNTTSRLETA